MACLLDSQEVICFWNDGHYKVKCVYPPPLILLVTDTDQLPGVFLPLRVRCISPAARQEQRQHREDHQLRGYIRGTLFEWGVVHFPSASPIGGSGEREQESIQRPASARLGSAQAVQCCSRTSLCAVLMRRVADRPH